MVKIKTTYAEELFSKALKIKEPLFVKEVEFESEANELHIHLDFKRGSRFPCPISMLDPQRLHFLQMALTSLVIANLSPLGFVNAIWINIANYTL